MSIDTPMLNLILGGIILDTSEIEGPFTLEALANYYNGKRRGYMPVPPMARVVEGVLQFDVDTNSGQHQLPENSQSWHCNWCDSKGVIMYDDSETVHHVKQHVMKAHAESSPDCHATNGIALVQIPVPPEQKEDLNKPIEAKPEERKSGYATDRNIRLAEAASEFIALHGKGLHTTTELLQPGVPREKIQYQLPKGFDPGNWCEEMTHWQSHLRLCGRCLMWMRFYHTEIAIAPCKEGQKRLSAVAAHQTQTADQIAAMPDDPATEQTYSIRYFLQLGEYTRSQRVAVGLQFARIEGGLCDGLIVHSICKMPNGASSQATFSVDGKTGEELPPSDWHKAWCSFTQNLAESPKFATVQQRIFFQDCFEQYLKKFIPEIWAARSKANESRTPNGHKDRN